MTSDPFGDSCPPAKASRPRPEARAKRAGPFTTKAAKEWARAQGWRILHSESFDNRLNRTHDAWLGSDLACSVSHSDPFMGRGIVLVQAGQKGEEKAHLAKSQELAQKWAKHFGIKPQDCTLEFVCQAHGWTFLWVEFSRGKKAPDRVAYWVMGMTGLEVRG